MSGGMKLELRGEGGQKVESREDERKEEEERKKENRKQKFGEKENVTIFPGLDSIRDEKGSKWRKNENETKNPFTKLFLSLPLTQSFSIPLSLLKFSFSCVD